jgi:enoyl-[acyl-carrier protein] reductase II
MKRFQEKGIKVVPVVASVALAKRMVREGADALIVEGTEAGGHIGELTTIALVPQVARAVSVPVIAAGGIATGGGVLAALSLGAQGVQMGTRFACTKECSVHPKWKEVYIKAGDRDTVVTGRSTGHPVRIIKNRLARRFQKLEKEGALVEELEKLGAGALRIAARDGEVQEGSVMAGQIVGIIEDEPTVEDVIQRVLTEAREILNSLCESYGS